MTKISDIIIEDGTINLNIDKTRTTIRAIIYKEGKLLMVYAHKFDDYTFPGGGMKKNEDHFTALKREIKEELGANHITNIRPYGYIEEKRYGISNEPTVYLQTSYYYMVDVSDFGQQSLADREKEHGVEPVWITIDEAVKANEQSMKTYSHKRGMKTVLPREMAVLKKLKTFITREMMRQFEVVTIFKDKGINLPKRATKYSAGYDIESASDYIILPGAIQMIDTGLKVDMQDNEALMIYPRSSLGIKKGLIMSNAVGIIDKDYYNNANNEGHIMIPLYNFSQKETEIKKGERVAQGIFQQYLTTSDDDAMHERTGGFGSSGK